jgi:hypothetical protein
MFLIASLNAPAVRESSVAILAQKERFHLLQEADISQATKKHKKT